METLNKIPTARRDKIIIEQIKEDKSAGGIYLPDVKVPEAIVGRVVAIGDGMVTITGETIPVCVEVGDRIVTHNDSMLPFHYAGKMYGVITDGDIHAVLPPFDPADNPPPVPLVVGVPANFDPTSELAKDQVESLAGLRG